MCSMFVFCVFQTFEGNVNSEGVVRNELQHTILARYIRFIPVDWSREGRIGVRLEVYGCSYCEYKWTREGKLIQAVCSILEWATVHGLPSFPPTVSWERPQPL